MQTPEDFSVWLQCLYLWTVIHIGGYRTRWHAWRLERRAAAERHRQLQALELWGPGHGDGWTRIVWDIDQGDARAYMRGITGRTRDIEASVEWPAGRDALRN